MRAVVAAAGCYLFTRGLASLPAIERHHFATGPRHVSVEDFMQLLGYPVYDIVVLVVIAIVGGGIVQALAGFSPGGCLISLVFGFLGAWLASWLALQFDLPRLFSIPLNGQSIELVWPLIGALLFTLVLSFLTQRMIANM
jgi:uncharacterized membrane protein YeaQ/YmgE (transglycosylase-associated protein family)